jgi:anti-anti-sigma regulatory factor
MEIETEQIEGRVTVTVLRVQGDLDASSYLALIARARELYNAGARHLLIDMSAVPYMGSSGLVALHSIAVLLRGEQPTDPEAGWHAFRSMDRDLEGGRQHDVKLLNPRPAVNRVLETSGMNQFFDIHTDRQAALESF